MKKYHFFLFFIATMTFLSLIPANADTSANNTATTPKLNQNRKWRIGYYEGGPYENYQSVLNALIHGLIEIGWINDTQFPQPPNLDETTTIWNRLCQPDASPYIEFVKQAYWSANWNDQKRIENQKACIAYLNKGKGVDLMIAMGTWAGQDLANNDHHTPTIVCSSTDPIEAGIVKSIEDSGYDHVHARLDPTLHLRQLRLFHEFVQFKTLGIAYCNTPAGKTYAAVSEVEQVARERGFDIVRCYTQDDVTDKTIAEKSVVDCYRKLAPKVDAMYVTIQQGVSLPNMPKIIAPLIEYKIPSFSQRSSVEVEHGILMSFAISGFKNIGRFHARTIAQIFNGAKPRQLNQVFHDPKIVALNLKTAKLIGYKVPEDLLAVADPIFKTIASQVQK